MTAGKGIVHSEMPHTGGVCCNPDANACIHTRGMSDGPWAPAVGQFGRQGQDVRAALPGKLFSRGAIGASLIMISGAEGW